MKSRASLALLEQLIMILVLVLAAALCLQAFAWADSRARLNTDRDHALQQAQSAAETLKSTGGDLDAAAALLGGARSGDGWSICFDSDWQQADEGTRRLTVTPCSSGHALLGMATVQVYDGSTLLAELTVCYQEVTP